MSRSRLAALLLVVAAVVSGCVAPTGAPAPQPPAQPAKPPKRAVFMAGYKPQANLPFVGVYVAREKGFFKEQNLEVEILHSAGQGEHLKLLLAGHIQFTTANAESVLKQIADADAPISAIALIGQKSEQAYAVLADSGINSPRDWEGRTVGYKVYPSPEYLAILKAAGVDRSKIKEVSVGFDPRILLERKVDVYPLFISNEPYLLRKFGADIRLFDASQYGVPTLGLTYIVRRDLIKEDPDLIERFLKAALKGLYYAFDNEAEAVDIVMKYAPREDKDHMAYMLRTEKARALTELTRARGLGWMTYEQWRALHDMLAEFKGISKPIDVNLAFTDEFLKRIYDGQGRLRWP
jgi:ABC-type nitrate/sulfonate/bicarbonate transport system substrate-binding protein